MPDSFLFSNEMDHDRSVLKFSVRSDDDDTFLELELLDKTLLIVIPDSLGNVIPYFLSTTIKK
jgi:hypothetical protein